MRNCPKVQRYSHFKFRLICSCLMFVLSIKKFLILFIGYKELFHIQYKSTPSAALILKKQSCAVVFMIETGVFKPLYV